MNNSQRPKLSKLVGLVLIATTLLFIPTLPLVAQSQEPQKPVPEVQQLLERLQQLEQTVEGLKAQLKVIEDAKKTTATATGEKVAAPVATTTTHRHCFRGHRRRRG